MKKTLVQINSVCNGSTGRIMQQIQEAAISNGMNAISFYGRGEPGKVGEYIKIGNYLDTKLHGVATRLFDKHGHYSKKATKKMIEQIKNINPDVIQLHNLHGYYLNLKLLFDYLKESNIKVIWTLHDCWAFTGHCSCFTEIKCNKWKTGCYSCPQKKEYPKSLIFDNSNSEYDFKKETFNGIKDMSIITPSKWLVDLVKESFLGNYKVKVINNGIDLNIFKPIDGSKIKEKLCISEEKKIILGVASIWSEVKGLKYFLEISKIIDKDRQIVLVGLNKKQIKQLPKSIIGIERTENINELVEIYSMADVFFNPSLEETFSLVTAEALACGTPCIIFNSAATPELIDKNVGTILNDFRIEKINKEINNIICEPKSKYSSNCVKKIIDKEKNKIYKKYIEMYLNE